MGLFVKLAKIVFVTFFTWSFSSGAKEIARFEFIDDIPHSVATPLSDFHFSVQLYSNMGLKLVLKPRGNLSSCPFEPRTFDFELNAYTFDFLFSAAVENLSGTQSNTTDLREFYREHGIACLPSGERFNKLHVRQGFDYQTRTFTGVLKPIDGLRPCVERVSPKSELQRKQAKLLKAALKTLAISLGGDSVVDTQRDYEKHINEFHRNGGECRERP